MEGVGKLINGRHMQRWEHFFLLVIIALQDPLIILLSLSKGWAIRSHYFLSLNVFANIFIGLDLFFLV